MVFCAGYTMCVHICPSAACHGPVEAGGLDGAGPARSLLEEVPVILQYFTEQMFANKQGMCYTKGCQRCASAHIGRLDCQKHFTAPGSGMSRIKKQSR